MTKSNYLRSMNKCFLAKYFAKPLLIQPKTGHAPYVEKIEIE